MEKRRQSTGLVVSGVAHAALLVFALVGFAATPKFDDAQESVPLEMISSQQFNDIMKGEKTAKKVLAVPKAQKLAEIAKIKPDTQTPEVQRDILVPMPPLRPAPDPGTAETAKPPLPPVKVAAPPPPPAKPEPVKPVVVKPPTPLPPEPPKAEIIKPLPKPPEKPVAKIEPPKKVPLPPKLPPKPLVKVPEKPKFDQMAKFLDQQKLKDISDKAAKPQADKPKSGNPANKPAPKLDLASIADMLNKDRPQQSASTGAKISQLASLGAPKASATKMSPSMWGQFAGLMREHFHQCWTTNGLDMQSGYVAKIALHFTRSGAFSAPPVWTNKTSSPAQQTIGESALSALQNCPALSVPPQFARYYDEWKDFTVGMNPEQMQ